MKLSKRMASERSQRQSTCVEWEEKERKKQKDTFVRKDQGAMSTALVLRNDDTHSIGRGVASAAGGSAAAAKSGEEKGENALKHVSYWLVILTMKGRYTNFLHSSRKTTQPNVGGTIESETINSITFGT